MEWMVNKNDDNMAMMMGAHGMAPRNRTITGWPPESKERPNGC